MVDDRSSKLLRVIELTLKPEYLTLTASLYIVSVVIYFIRFRSSVIKFQGR